MDVGNVDQPPPVHTRTWDQTLNPGLCPNWDGTSDPSVRGRKH